MANFVSKEIIKQGLENGNGQLWDCPICPMDHIMKGKRCCPKNKKGYTNIGCHVLGFRPRVIRLLTAYVNGVKNENKNPRAGNRGLNA